MSSTTEEPQWNSAYTSECLMGSTQMSLLWIDRYLAWLWLSRENIHGNNSKVVLRYMQWKITSADCFQSWRQTCSKNQAQHPVENFHLLLSPFMTRVWLANQSLCCITQRLSSSVLGDYLLPSEGPVLIALYSLLLERNSLLLVMRLSNLLALVAICFQEPTCIELWRQPCQCAIHRARRLHDSRHTQLSTKFASLSNGKNGNLGEIHVLSDWADDNNGTCNHDKEVKVLGQHRQRC